MKYYLYFKKQELDVILGIPHYPNIDSYTEINLYPDEEHNALTSLKNTRYILKNLSFFKDNTIHKPISQYKNKIHIKNL